MSQPIKVKEFSTFLRNRNKEQTDGLYTGVEFREKYLSELEIQDWWDDSAKKIVLDFEGVTTISPSWANEVFAYFTSKKFKNVDTQKIFNKIELKNISKVKLETIEMEIKDGYRGASFGLN